MIDLEQHEFVSFDGTRIGYFTGGKADGPDMVLANGWGGNRAIWHHILRRYGKDYRIVNWDYRGLYSSGPAPSINAYSVPNQVADLIGLLDHLKIESATFVAWSMGVQICLETCRDHQDRVDAMVLMQGSSGKNGRKLVEPKKVQELKYDGCAKLSMRGDGFVRAGRKIAKQTLLRPFARVTRKLGLVGPNIEIGSMSGLVQSWLGNDLRVFFSILCALDDNDTDDVMPDVSCPTLVIAGAQDSILPPVLSEYIAARVPGAKLLSIAGGSHFAMIEEPEQILQGMDKFLGGLHPGAPDTSSVSNGANA